METSKKQPLKVQKTKRNIRRVTSGNSKRNLLTKNKSNADSIMNKRKSKNKLNCMSD